MSCRPHDFNTDTNCGPLGLRLRSTYFQYDGSIYEQDGAAMGSPVSAAIANPYAEDCKPQASSSAPCTPNTWECYVDDTFTILNRDNVDNFLQHFNSQQPTIRFKMETKIDNTIPCHFLTHWSHRIQTDDSPIVFIDSPRTLINTLPCLRTLTG